MNQSRETLLDRDHDGTDKYQSCSTLLQAANFLTVQRKRGNMAKAIQESRPTEETFAWSFYDDSSPFTLLAAEYLMKVLKVCSVPIAQSQRPVLRTRAALPTRHARHQPTPRGQNSQGDDFVHPRNTPALPGPADLPYACQRLHIRGPGHNILAKNHQAPVRSRESRSPRHTFPYL